MDKGLWTAAVSLFEESLQAQVTLPGIVSFKGVRFMTQSAPR